MKMFRLRRRFVFAFCGAISMFLFYFLYNAVPSLEAKNGEPQLGVIEQKLQRIEHGMERYGKEMRQIKTRLEQSWKNTFNSNNIDKKEQQLKKPQIKEQEQEQGAAENPLIHFDQEVCMESIDMQQVPQPDIQMLEMYNKMSFADNDGGVWKQGWDIKYDPLKFNDHHRLKVFVVPHSHNDPGWIKTFDDYYEHDTKHILSNALRHLKENPDMKFIWAEISYFSRFYEDLGENNKKDMKKLVQNGQFEFVTGGWVMPDEANSHWLSVLLQLTEGQTWLKTHMNVTPTSSWSIDPFGHSPTLPYILKKSSFQNLLIQRTHYAVKKALAQERNLEFYWRQMWDDTSSSELFTHMMPFYSYDIPHTCGPDPKICCQFDFKRIQGFGLSCPWRVPPQAINENNVVQRAELLVDQWKKKSELYRTNVLLIPLGDDFRYSQSTEWDVQRMNYEALFDHINSQTKHYVEAKFGTLQEYFDAVHREEHEQKREFPTLSGDFFTYADRADNYWSGYYTSRPYHKRMDRVLLNYVRSAEMLHAWHFWDNSTKFSQMLQNARRELSLFQHHDGITGTAKTHVVQDYAHRMVEAVKMCKFVMQQAVYRLLTNPSIYNADYKFNYFYLDDSHWPGPDDSRTTIILGEELPSKYVVLHNSQPQWREDIVDFYVSSPYVSVSDFEGNAIEAQVSPMWTWHRHTLGNMVTITPQASTTKYRLIFKANVPPLGLVTYRIELQSADSPKTTTKFAKNSILTTTPISVNLGEYPEEVKFGQQREISLQVGDGPAVAFSSEGHMKSIQIDEESPHTPVHLKFYKYGTRISGDKSGAYLFLPNGPATAFVNIQPPVVLVTEGQLESSITAGLPFVIHQTVLRGAAPEIRNLVDIAIMDNTEIVMRISTHIQNGDDFFTDLNGLQLVKRKRFSKIPLQANYYPIPSAIYIEDDTTRLTVLTAQPLGGSSLVQGEIEIMQDRRLTHDDERGLGQGVLDNQPVLHIFRVVLEKVNACTKLPETHPSGALTSQAYRASKSILSPLNKFIFSENDWFGVKRYFGADHKPLEEDMEIAVMRDLASKTSVPNAHVRSPVKLSNTGIIVHRTNLLYCANDSQRTGALYLNDLIRWGQNVTNVKESSLTFLKALSKQDSNSATITTLCPMDSKAFIIQHYS